MLSEDARRILTLLKSEAAMDGPEIEDLTGLSEGAIKAAAVELRDVGLITTSGADNMNEDSGQSIDRLAITRLGKAR